MSLPGNRIPDANLPDHGSSVPARAADMPPVWCRHSVSWSWVGRKGGYLCDDPDHHRGPPAVQVGAIDVEHQPTFASPPNEAQRIGMQIWPDDR